jgi:hypothetical protein
MNAAQFWESFQRFSLWSLGALSLPPLLIALSICIVSLIAAFFWQRPFRGKSWHGSYWLVFTQLLFFPATIVVGLLFPANGVMPKPVPSAVGRWWLDALWYLSLAVGCFWVYRMKGLRWFAASLVALQEILLVGAYFVAGMSVTGDWL